MKSKFNKKNNNKHRVTLINGELSITINNKTVKIRTSLPSSATINSYTVQNKATQTVHITASQPNTDSLYLIRLTLNNNTQIIQHTTVKLSKPITLAYPTANTE